MCLIDLLDFLIIGLANWCVLLVIALFLAYMDYQEDKAYYESVEFKNRF